MDKVKILLCIAILALTAFAWTNRFVMDDAFISYRYAENLVTGKGLVWNTGERVEGYTNFLWTLVMAVPIHFKIDPVTFSYILGILFFLLSLAFSYKIAVLILKSPVKALWAVLLLGTNYTFSAYATGGLETQGQACLFVAALYLLLRSMISGNWQGHTAGIISLLLSLALLIRLDSALLVLVVFPAALLSILREKLAFKERLARLSALFLPLLILVGSWFIWKLYYYGDILPNTFYIRVFDYKRGLRYLGVFFESYWLLPFVLFGIAALKTIIKTPVTGVRILVLQVIVWLIYVVKVGGDFMEFRFMVTIMPVLFILLVWLIFTSVQKKEIQAALMIFILLGSWHHYHTFKGLFFTYGIESVQELADHIEQEGQNWRLIGSLLGKSLNYDPDVVIATTAAGAIPYYSRLQTVDMLGLNDKWLARNGKIAGSVPGHQRTTTFDYLYKRKVNLLIGHPWIKSRTDKSESTYKINEVIGILSQASFMTIGNQTDIFPDSRVIEIPLDDKYDLIALYLLRNSTVDKAIDKHNWHVYPIIRVG